jgi:hypothetical protein
MMSFNWCQHTEVWIICPLGINPSKAAAKLHPAGSGEIGFDEMSSLSHDYFSVNIVLQIVFLKYLVCELFLNVMGNPE